MHPADILLSYKIRPSIHRILIYQYLLDNRIHPTADIVYTNLSTQLPTLSRTTVYNTLSLLAKKKLIQELPLETSELRYDADTSPHAHFKCDKCGQIYDLTMNVPLPELPNNFTIYRKQLFLWGICPACQTQQQ